MRYPDTYGNHSHLWEMTVVKTRIRMIAKYPGASWPYQMGVTTDSFFRDAVYTGYNKDCLTSSEVRRIHRRKHHPGLLWAGTTTTPGKSAAIFCLRVAGKYHKPVVWGGGSLQGRDAAGSWDGGAYGLAAGAGTTTLVRLDKTGQLSWKKMLPLAKSASLQSMVASNANSAVLVGEVKPVGSRDGLVVKVAVDGKLVWVKEVDAGADDRILAVARHRVDNLVFAGVRKDNSVVHSHWYGGMDQHGKLLYSTVAPLPDLTQLDTIHVRPDGGVLMAGRRELKGEVHPLVLRADGGGHTVWSRHYRGPSNEQLYPVRDTLSSFPDGRIVLGTTAMRPKSKDNPYVSKWTLGIIMDGSGHPHCNGPGKCKAMVANQACNDGNPCTIDFCDPTSGCTHNAAHEVSCGTAKVCAQGKCVKS